MKKKIILTLLFMASLTPMFLNQYGGAKGVQEITGFINLTNPIGLLSVVLFVLGVWGSFKHQSTNKMISVLGMCGMVVSEIYEFFTWHIFTITGHMSIQNSVQLAYPEYYFGLCVSMLMIVAYFVVDKFVKI